MKVVIFSIGGWAFLSSLSRNIYNDLWGMLDLGDSVDEDDFYPKIEIVDDTVIDVLTFPKNTLDCMCGESPKSARCVCNDYCLPKEVKERCTELIGAISFSRGDPQNEFCLSTGHAESLKETIAACNRNQSCEWRAVGCFKG